MAIKKSQINVTLNGSGALDQNSKKITGKLISIRYAKGNFSDGVDFTITNLTSGETLWAEENVNASAIKVTKSPIHLGSTGAAIASQYDYFYLANESVRFVVANGGDSKIGSFIIVYDDGN